ncbi:XRE family transcriptional regulator [Brevibacillus laterosporus]|uniref:XRE family transcriptional regulator n=1 Tax=Brevibacillus laterosporus TaxID=1465 RepID=A0A518V8V2_BRELA|nr:XRE family transcriptional regulator [Brevibacillus laterosporus]
MGRNETLIYTSLGDLIKKKREKIGMSLSELSRLTRISKGVLHYIETGETKRPELKTLKPIADVLSLPYKEIVEHYIEVEQRVEALYKLLAEANEISNIPFISKVARKILESPSEDTYTSLQRLYDHIVILTSDEIKLLLSKVITKYARQHGVPQFVANGLFQQYMIEREDLKRLEESLRDGEEILHYTDFLSREDTITYYYRMALHAYNIKRYEKCIKFGQKGFIEDTSSNELKERVALVMCHSYIHLNDHESAEECVNNFVKMGYQFVIDHSKPIRANIYLKREDYNSALPLLRECLDEATVDTYLHRLNDLLEVLSLLNDTDSIYHILTCIEEKKIFIDVNTPYKYRELGRYHKLKGEYEIKTRKFDEGITTLLASILNYEKISAYEEINQCVGIILNCQSFNQKHINTDILGNLVYIYNKINKVNV